MECRCHALECRELLQLTWAGAWAARRPLHFNTQLLPKVLQAAAGNSRRFAEDDDIFNTEIKFLIIYQPDLVGSGASEESRNTILAKAPTVEPPNDKKWILSLLGPYYGNYRSTWSTTFALLGWMDRNGRESTD